MTKQQAIRIVWSRMATTARGDADLGEWQFDESEDPKDQARLEEACRHVADVCEAKATGKAVRR
jgi:hypothetical protein